MKNRVGLWRCVVGVLVALAMPCAQALTLADLTGVAVLGRALDVSVKVQTDTAELVTANCIGAEVFYADAPQLAPVVSVAAPVQGVSVVRIQSAAMVNEPVVAVLVRSSCGASSQRRYVLLADFPHTAASSSAAVAADAGSTASATASANPMLVLPTAVPTTLTTAPAPAKSKPVKVRKPTANPAKKTSTVVHAPPPTRGTSLLKLDPLAIFSDRIDALDTLMVFEPTQDALKQTQQINTLEKDLKALREATAQSNARLLELSQQLDAAHAQQLPTLLVYVLLGVVLLCLAALGWLWRKQQSLTTAHMPWWQPDDAPSTLLMPQPVAPSAVNAPPNPPVDKAPEKVATATRTTTTTTTTTAALYTPVPTAEPNAEVDLDIDLSQFISLEPVVPVSAPALPETAATTAGAPPVPQPALAPPRSSQRLFTDQMLDIRQQADFFMSLGQTDRALQLLNTHTDETALPNPTVCLDLLNLYHTLGMKADFRELRTTMQHTFNLLLADFPGHTLPTKTLQDYPETLAEITATWPQPAVLLLLDACLFHDPTAQVRALFELDAYQELLMLHGMAEDITDVPELPPTRLPSVSAPAKFQMPEPWLSESLETSQPNLLDAPTASFSTPDVPATTAEPELSLLPRLDWAIAPQPSAPPPEAPPEASPTSMMLDLDFSSLVMPAAGAPKPAADNNEPIAAPAMPYAARAGRVVGKK